MDFIFYLNKYVGKSKINCGQIHSLLNNIANFFISNWQGV